MDWMSNRIDALDALLRRDDYRGHDPFDLPNSPLLPVPEHWVRTQLVISKFGSRLAPDWLRRALRVPLIEDPKTYACAYFAYRALGRDDDAAATADRLARLAAPTWGYDFTWPTRTSGINPRGASTLVPGAFAIFALADAVARGVPHGDVLARATDHYATRHRSAGPDGEFLAYFAGGGVNTHNANLLGCAALSVAAHVLGRDDWQEVSARCAETTLVRVGDDGYIRYAEHRSGEWTDCFHHLYVMASLLALARLNPELDAERAEAAVERMRAYLRREFLRGDGLLNYYAGQLYPIDPHNYAAAAIYAVLFGSDDDIPSGQAGQLLRVVDERMWDERRGCYLHRRYRRRTDGRVFVRWTQAWMLAALALASRRDVAWLPGATAVVDRRPQVPVD